MSKRLEQALAFHRAGAHAAAESAYRKILVSEPQNAEALHLLGVLMGQIGQSYAGASLVNRAIGIKPFSALYHHSLGNLRLQLGDLEGAKAGYLKAITLEPKFLDGHINLGNVYLAEKNFGQAVASYKHAVGVAPLDRGAVMLLGIASMRAGDLEEAAHAFLEATKIDPGHATSHQLLGHVLLEDKQFLNSIPCFEGALHLNPKDHEAWNGLGVALDGLGEFAGAAPAFAAALALKPDSAEYLVNVGLNKARRKDVAAIGFLERAVAIEPGKAEAHDALADVLLLFGHYGRGFREYEWRWRTPALSSRIRPFKQPMWDGSPLNGRTILLHAEQGYGDTIQFSRFVAEVSRGEGVVLLEVQPRLFRLLRRLRGVDVCLRQGVDALPEFDVHCPLMSLPYVLGTEEDTVPPPVELPLPTSGTPLGDAASPLRVGLVWAGNPAHKRDAFRSMPLSAFIPLSKISGVELFSLQKEIPERDIPVLTDSAIRRPAQDEADFLDTVAIIGGLDLVISVDTAVAHLAASMGKPVWMILPEAADWRWGASGDRTVWYPTMRLIRHEKNGEHGSVVSRIRQELACFERAAA